MKKLILLSILFFSHVSFAQDWGMIQETLSRKQQQYDSGYARVQAAYTELVQLKLINKENVRVLDDYKNTIKKGLQNLEKVDFGIPANVEGYLKYINKYRDYTPIKDEADLLHKINAEVINLKAKDPGSFTNTDRFKELAAIMKELEICHQSTIKDLGWKHGIL